VTAAAKAKRKEGTSASHALGEYAGTYTNPGYGPVTINSSGSALRLKFNTFELPLKHFHYDVFETDAAEGASPIRWKVQFHMDPDGVITSLTVPVEGALPPTGFTKEGAKK
jgi:hypothetical protein